MPFLILLLAIVVLILLITWVKLNAFISFVIVSVLCAMAYGMDVSTATAALQKGIGNTTGQIIVIIGLGAVLGKLVADSGAAQKISLVLVKAFGKNHLMWALLLTSFIVGLPLFYGVVFVLMVPIIINASDKYKLPIVYIGLPALSAMSVTHGFLPPHPSPTTLVSDYHADMGMTLLFGLAVAIPTILCAGPLFATTLKKYNSKPLAAFAAKPVDEKDLPGGFLSMFTAFLPVLLIALAAIVKAAVSTQNILTAIIYALGDPIVAMSITVLFAVYMLGVRRGTPMKDLEKSVTIAIKDISPIIFIIGGAGGLNEVLSESGMSHKIADALQNLHIHPLLAAWSIAAIIRVSLGSSTVAAKTTAGIVAPMIAISHVNPNLMVLATGAGSLMFSHVNDSGFWLFKEYFNLSIKDTIKTWSLMESIVSVVGLAAVLLLNVIIS